MSRDFMLYVDDILEAAARIDLYVHGFDFAAFANDTKTQDAVIRNLEIIGEAVTCLPEHVKARYPEIEWRKIIGLRNILAHEYFGVSLPVIWDVVEHKLSALTTACLAMRKTTH